MQSCTNRKGSSSDDDPFLNARPRYVLTLVPLPGVNAIRALRWILKSALRQHGMRCVDIGVDHVAGSQSRDPVGKAAQPARQRADRDG